MGKFSREKGKRGEREAAAELNRLLGISARRGQQFAGSPDSPDVVAPELSGVHLEVKRTEKLNLYAAIEQAIKDAGPDQRPLILHKKNHRPWVAIIQLNDLPAVAMAVAACISFNDVKL